MLYDEYFENQETGELLPGTDAIRDFYKSHGALDDWTELWKPSGIMSEKPLDAPDFTRVF